MSEKASYAFRLLTEPVCDGCGDFTSHKWTFSELAIICVRCQNDWYKSEIYDFQRWLDGQKAAKADSRNP